MTFDASNEKAIKNRKRRERRARERAIADLKWVMSEKSGRRFVWGLLSDCKVFQSSFTMPNGLQIAFNEGSRNVGLALLGRLHESCLDEYHLAQSEAMAFEKYEAETETALDPTPEEEETHG